MCSKLNGVPNHVDENLPQPKRVADEGIGCLPRDFAVKFKIFLTGRSDEGLGNSVHNVTSLNSIGSMSSLPAPILEYSRMSLMMASSESADILSMFRSSRCSAVRSVSNNNSAMPRTPFIGVRSS